ncbi:MAG TPA: hypothetical protein EYN67_01110 [Flavobacteriales bacterium]|jgi:hypothetical protein|nr:hypothetical protein [Flavobacteriales bacterium]
MLKSIFYIVIVWFIWRWLDRIFGWRRRNRDVFGTTSNPQDRPQSPPKSKTPNDNKIGDYVDFEEVED